MINFLTRSQAARAAHRAGHANFKTRPSPLDRGTWVYHAMKGTSPAEEWAKDKDFVHHVESDWIDEGRSPGYIGVLVVTLTLEELKGIDIPAEFRVEPLTPELWGRSTHTSASRGSKGSSDRSIARAKSDVENPTKLVWSIADSMPSATRNEIVAACIAAGVNKSTASTQFYKWQKARND